MESIPMLCDRASARENGRPNESQEEKLACSMHQCFRRSKEHQIDLSKLKRAVGGQCDTDGGVRQSWLLVCSSAKEGGGS